MWESRPLPKIVRDPLAAHSARGSFLSPVSASCALAGTWTGRYLLVLACIPLRLLPDACGVPACRMGRGRSFVLAVMQVSSTVVHNRQEASIVCSRPPCGQASIWREPVGATARHKRSPALRVLSIVPGISRGFFVGAGMRCWPATHACPSPLCLAAPRQEDSVLWQADRSGRLLVVFQGNVTRQRRQTDAGRSDAGENFWRKFCGEGNLFGKRFSLPVPHPSKNFCRWACATLGKPAERKGRRPSRKAMSRHCKNLNVWFSRAET